MRLGRISEYRDLMIDFTNPMNFPSLSKFIENNDEGNHDLLNVMMLSGDTDEID